jgi:hypothetical protein
MLRGRRAARLGARVPVGAVVPALPLRGFAADRMPVRNT